MSAPAIGRGVRRRAVMGAAVSVAVSVSAAVSLSLSAAASIPVWVPVSVALFGVGSLTSLPAAATETTRDEARRIRAVIEDQLAAFAADDAARAFAHATPALQATFGGADRFLQMVRDSYPVVYRPAGVAFLKPDRQGSVVTQGVHLTDRDGVLWLALYRLERQAGGAWRIAACQVVEARGRAA